MAKEKKIVQSGVDISLGELFDSLPVLRLLRVSKMPVATGLRVERILREVEPETTAFVSARDILVEKHVKYETVEEDGTPEPVIRDNRYIFKTKEDEDVFSQEITTMRNERTVLYFTPISVEDVDRIKVPKGDGGYEQWEPTVLELSLIVYALDIEI